MKWVIIGLFGLGLAAAVCAAVLVASFQGGSDTSGEPVVADTAVLVAGHDMDSLTMLDASDVATHSIARAALPAGALTDPVQAVGRVLLAPVKEGEALTTDCFVTDASAARLAASLLPGMRAVNVSLTDAMGVEGLLVPGSVVDVLASIDMKNTDGSRQEPVSLTLLQGVRVLGVGSRSIVAPEESVSAPGTVSSSQRPNVTLLVDAHQAEKLKLAMQEGSVTLALRNPKDVSRVDVLGTGLASLSPIFADAPAMAMPAPMTDSPAAADVLPSPPASGTLLAPQVPEVLKRQWETVILRGGVAETRSFPLSEAGHDG